MISVANKLLAFYRATDMPRVPSDIENTGNAFYSLYKFFFWMIRRWGRKAQPPAFIYNHVDDNPQ